MLHPLRCSRPRPRGPRPRRPTHLRDAHRLRLAGRLFPSRCVRAVHECISRKASARKPPCPPLSVRTHETTMSNSRVSDCLCLPDFTSDKWKSIVMCSPQLCASRTQHSFSRDPSLMSSSSFMHCHWITVPLRTHSPCVAPLMHSHAHTHAHAHTRAVAVVDDVEQDVVCNVCLGPRRLGATGPCEQRCQVV
jgi:hypothetical protein